LRFPYTTLFRSRPGSGRAWPWRPPRSGGRGRCLSESCSRWYLPRTANLPAASARDEHLVELGEQVLFGGQVPGPAAGGGLGGAARRGSGQRRDRCGERGGGADGHQGGGLPGDPPGAARIGRDDRPAGPERLLQRHRLPLPPGGGDDQVGGGEQGGDVVAASEQLDREVFGTDAGGELLVQRTVPGDPDPHRWAV